MGVIPLGSLVFVYVFLFKMMSHMQSRLGPMEAGPHGALQPVVEAIKFLQKEDIFPERADRLVFGLAPFVVLVSTFMLYAVVP
ncbi:MAG: NADH-quinone oxidoreductase subunit H, partial [Actinobacteria bacterium]|nr:NADH-quinone oxidoreductase subunit H [Actinomycetota bacterium]